MFKWKSDILVKKKSQIMYVLKYKTRIFNYSEFLRTKFIQTIVRDNFSTLNYELRR